MVLVLTLLTIQSKLCLHVSCKGGAQGLHHFIIMPSDLDLNSHLTRCTADPRKSFKGNANIRSQEHTDFLATNFDIATLWDDYGVVDGVRVCFFLPLRYSAI